jgi:hypothetical protein
MLVIAAWGCPGRRMLLPVSKPLLSLLLLLSFVTMGGLTGRSSILLAPVSLLQPPLTTAAGSDRASGASKVITSAAAAGLYAIWMGASLQSSNSSCVATGTDWVPAAHVMEHAATRVQIEMLPQSQLHAARDHCNSPAVCHAAGGVARQCIQHPYCTCSHTLLQRVCWHKTGCVCYDDMLLS